MNHVNRPNLIKHIYTKKKKKRKPLLKQILSLPKQMPQEELKTNGV